MHKLIATTDVSVRAARQIKDVNYKADKLLEALNRLPNSREKSLAITKVEESVMWANTCAARNM